jgi:rod shape-determining protein MreD
MRMQHYIQSALVALGLLLLQTTFIPLISLGSYLPDLFIIWLVYVALRRGQIEATASGFAVGLLQDIVSLKFFGLTALSKTVTGFVAGYFFNENTVEQTLGSYRFVLLILLCSFLHDLLYFFFFFQGSEEPALLTVLELSTGMTLFTGVIALLPMFFFSRKYHTSWASV